MPAFFTIDSDWTQNDDGLYILHKITQSAWEDLGFNSERTIQVLARMEGSVLHAQVTYTRKYRNKDPHTVYNESCDLTRSADCIEAIKDAQKQAIAYFK